MTTLELALLSLGALPLACYLLNRWKAGSGASRTRRQANQRLRLLRQEIRQAADRAGLPVEQIGATSRPPSPAGAPPTRSTAD